MRQHWAIPLRTNIFTSNRGIGFGLIRAIYRLKRFPASRHEELIRWWLWTRKKGVISHESAAAAYNLGEVLPSKTHVTVPQEFRKVPAPGVVLHKAKLEQKDTESREGYRVTTPLRTILDLARAHLDPERLTAVVKDAISKGLVEKHALLDFLAAMPRDIDPATQVTLQLALREP